MSRKGERVDAAITVQVAADRFVGESIFTTSGDAEDRYVEAMREALAIYDKLEAERA